MIEIKNLHYSYGKITALRGINLAANSGEITAIIGANGAGKSTLMKCIAGLLKPNIGEILCDGERLPAEPHNVVKRNIVLVPEGRWIFPNLTVEENLKMGAYTVKDNTENMEKAYAMFNRLGERKRQLAGTLSGGEQQMLAIARALMSNPKTILFDEPSLGQVRNFGYSRRAECKKNTDNRKPRLCDGARKDCKERQRAGVGER